MADVYHCWKCGAALAGMILPISRREECAACGAEIHVCRQCIHYHAQVSNQCREERAEDVSDKQRANFCDYFAAHLNPFRGDDTAAAQKAAADLAALFGDGPASQQQPSASQPSLDDLFDIDPVNKD